MKNRLICEKCSITKDIPQHCGKPMHIEEVDGKEMLVCWMGADCGIQDLPVHHEKPMKIV